MAIKFKRPQPPCSTSHTPTNLRQEFNYWNQVLLTWDPIPGVSSYAIWEDYTKQQQFVYTNKISLTEIGSPGTSDDWGVRVKCGGSYGNWAFSDFTSPECTKEITGITFTNVTPTSFTCTWDPIPGVFGYNYWDNDQAALTYLQGGSNNNSITRTGLSPAGKTVTMGVRARCYPESGFEGEYTFDSIDLP
jgi:hypothetical protein